MFELFEKYIDKVKFPLESPTIFLPDDGALNNVKHCVPMKDIAVFFRDQDASIQDAMNF